MHFRWGTALLFVERGAAEQTTAPNLLWLTFANEGDIRRVDVDALHLPAIARQECLECFEVIPLDQQVFGIGIAERQLWVTLQQPSRHPPMMIHDGLFADPIQRWHAIVQCSKRVRSA